MGYCLPTMSDMSAFALTCFIGALAIAILAIWHQRTDFIPNHGNSMGAAIVGLFMWMLASLLVAAGSLAYIGWYYAPGIFAGAIVLSLLIRNGVERWQRHLDQKRALQPVRTRRTK